MVFGETKTANDVFNWYNEYTAQYLAIKMHNDRVFNALHGDGHAAGFYLPAGERDDSNNAEAEKFLPVFYATGTSLSK